MLNQAECERVYKDHCISGGKAERPGLDEALRDLQEGDVMIVYKLDRLGRSILHLADVLTRMDNDGIHFCSLTEGINTMTPGARFVFHVFAAVAEFTRDLIRKNTASGLRAARERGVQIGRPYLMDKDMIIEAYHYMCKECRTLEQTAQRFNVSKSTLIRGFKRLDLKQKLSKRPNQ